jgi:hypothetical protein
MSNDLGVTSTGGKSYPVLEAKDYDAVVHGIVSLGRHPVEYQGTKKEPQVFLRIIVELPEVVREDGTTATTGKKIKVTNSVDKGNFAKFLTALGEKVTEANIESYFSNNAQKGLLGKAVVVTVEQWESDTGTAASIKEFTKLDPRLPKPQAKRETFFFNPLSPDLKVFKENLTFRTKQEVMSALNANQFPAELHQAWKEAQAENEQKKTNNQQTETTTAAPEYYNGDEPPFDVESFG